MGMLFNIGDDGAVDTNDWKAAKEWSKLTELEFRCVMLIWDNQSMYRRMEESQREERVLKGYLGADWEKFRKSAKYKEAMWLYRAVDFDIDLNMLEMYTKKLINYSMLLDQLETSDDIGVQKKYDAVNKNVANIMKIKADYEEKIAARGKINKNYKVILSGIEKFYERAKSMKNDHEIFRNLRAN